MTPRYYQQEAYDQTRQAFALGHKNICICMSGGAGKSLLCKMIIEAALKKNSKIGFFSFRKSLTEQIKTYFPEVPNIDIGTLQKWGKTETEEYDLKIVDEKDFYGTKLFNNIKAKYTIVLSGFPTDDKGNVLEFDYIVEAIQFPELVEQGYAKQIKVLSTSKVDTTSLKKQAGDFHKGQAFDMMDKATIKRDLVNTYKKYCIGRKTLLFAIDVKHAESLKDEFLGQGIKCDTVHSKKSDEAIHKFESGQLDLLINVAMITIGVDIPSINTIMFARPMCSVPLFMQCVWRGTRKFNDDYCLVIDCAEVIKRTEFHPMQRIDLTKKKGKKQQKKCKDCDSDMFIAGKKTFPRDELTYIIKTHYKCKCGYFEQDERMVVVNFNFCNDCEEVLDSSCKIEMKETKKAIEFVIKCECGHENVQRKILLTDAELKVIEHEENLRSNDDWVKIRAVLKDEAKRCGYKHQWVGRAMEILQGKDSKRILGQIDYLKSHGKKIGSIVYV